MKPITQAVLLDARQDVDSARAKVRRSEMEQVVVRRTEGLVVFWYAFETQHVLERLQANDDRVSVKQALDLHEYTAAPVQDIGSIGAEPLCTDTVIMDGPRFIGVRLAVALPDADLLDLPDMEEARPTITSSCVPSPPSPDPLLGIVRIFRKPWPRRAGRGIVDLGNVINGAEPSAGSRPAGIPPASEISTAFKAYPRLDAPPTVLPREQFSMTIGLALRPHPGTVGDPFAIDLPSAVERFTLDVLVIADGFGMPAGGRHILEVDRADPYAHPIHVPLLAPESVDDVLLTKISVIYFFEKVPCGTAARKIAVIPADTQPFMETHGNGELWTSGDEPRSAVTIRPGILGVDLTVTISKTDENPASGQFVWTFQSPHAIALPAAPVSRNL